MASKVVLKINAHMIEEFRNQECLWDTRSNEYFNKNKRIAALERMCRALNIPVTDEHLLWLKIKIKHLRTSFTRELRLMKSSERSDAARNDIYKPKWPFFENLQFLLPHCSTRPGKNNLDVAEDSSQEVALCDDHDDTNEESCAKYELGITEEIIRPEGLEESTNALHEPSSSASLSSSPSIFQTSKKCNFYKGKKTKKSSEDITAADSSVTLLAAQKILSDMSNSRQERRESEGEFYHYAMNLSKQLEKMNPEQALQCTNEINQIVHQYLFHNLHKSI